MTEDEYIIATNRAKVSAALELIRDVLPDYGISNAMVMALEEILMQAEKTLVSSIFINGEGYDDWQNKLEKALSDYSRQAQ